MKRSAVLALLFSTAFLLPAAGETRTPGDAASGSGVLGAVAAEPGADPALLDVVNVALGVQLERRHAQFAAFRENGALSGSLAEEGLRRAAERNQQYFLFGEYSTSSRELTLTLSLYDVATGRKISSASASGRIGLSLDSIVGKVMDKVLVGITFRTPEPSAAGSGTNAGSASAQPAAAGAGVAIGPGETAGPAVRGASRLTGEKPRAISLASSVAPFIPLGNGTYADLGILATLTGVIRFPMGPGLLGAGLLAGVSAMSAQGAATEATLLLVPVGAEVSYSMNEGGFPGIVVHASLGPAVMDTTTSYEGSLVKVVPYLLAGMRLDLPFTPYLGMALEAAWTGFFESTSLIIMGFVPGVSLYVRF